MHFRTHAKPESRGQAGRWQSPYHDTMIDHDKHVGVLLDQLDELGIADNTIVIYSTDNGPHMNTWPDGAMTPFRNEKNTNWEGAFRVPAHDALAGQDRRPGSSPMRSSATWTGCRRSWPPPANPISSRSCSRATRPATRRFKRSPRRLQPAAVPDRGGGEEPATGILLLLRRRRPDRRALSTTGSWCSWSSAPLARCRSGPSRSRSCGCRRCSTCAPIPSSVPTSPPTPTTTGCSTMRSLLVPAQAIVGEFLATFTEFPPRQKAASFTVDQVMEKLQSGLASG